MAAIFGFTGPTDEKCLHGMGHSLLHRGNGDLQSITDRNISIGFSSGGYRQKRGYLSGIIKREDMVLAIAGFACDTDKCIITLSDLLTEIRNRGTGVFSRLNGDYVCAYHDGVTTSLVRDMAGIRSIYYGQYNNRLVFSVEPKGLLAFPGFPRRLRPASLAQYLSFSFVAGSWTMFRDIQVLPPGHILTCREGMEPELRMFCDLYKSDFEHSDNIDTWSSRFVTHFQDAIQDRLPESGPVGIFLSGGIDSSIVTAEVSKLYSGPVKTWAVHFGPDFSHELDYASAVAKRCGTCHREVLIRPGDFLPKIRKMVWHLDEPIGDPITAPNFELARIASQEVDLIFNGEGGDPCFGGPKNIYMLLNHWYGGSPENQYFREKAYCLSFRRAYEDIELLLTPEFQRHILIDRDIHDVLTPYFTAATPKGFLDKLMTMNIRLKGASLILPKVERMLGAWGIDSLSPLFDWRIVQLSFAMPSRFKVKSGIEKYIFKHAYRDFLPLEVIVRPKSGMRVPVHFWFRGELKKYARKILNKKELKKNGIFNYEYVDQLLNYSKENGSGRHGLKLWMLITFEIWRRIFIEGESV